MMNISDAKQTQPAPFDAWAVFDFWLRRWRWLACWTILLAIVGAFVARSVWGRSFTSTAQLIHYEPSAIDDTFHPRTLATPSLVVMLQSPGLFEQVGSQLQPPLAAKDLARRLQVTLDRNNDIVTVTATGASIAATTDLVTRFCAAAIAYTQAMQRQEATEAGESVTRQLAQVENEITIARAAIPAASVATVAGLAALPEMPAAAASDLPLRLQAARDQLADLSVRYTDVHPLVREQRARVAALEESQRRAAPAATANSSAAARPAAALSPAFYGRITPEEVAMGERFRSLETNRALLVGRQRAIQPFRENPPGYFRVLQSVTANPTLEHRHRMEIVLFACLGAFFGLIGSGGLILVGEFMDNRIKTRADVRRVTGLPLLATLGDLKRLSPADRDRWAFRAWTALQSRLSISANHGMVCGITSAHPGDGRSTWIDLLARAAGNCGFRVLTITAQPSPEIAAELARRDPRATPAAPSVPSAAGVALTASVLSTPGQIVEQLSGANSQPRVDIPLPGWVWNLERRNQWQSALEAWRAIDHVVIFVELPPASVAETVLLAENVPNLLWLVDSNRSDAAETHSDLATLRDARCNLVGAVLNRERAAPLRGRFSRWFGSSVALLFLGLTLALPAPKLAAAQTEPAAGAIASVSSATTPAAFSVVDPAPRAAWQKRLTLGPGDVLSFHLFGSPELTRDDVPIGPDGRISYLEAENVVAAGLTVDELRERLNEELGKFRRAPQAFVTPLSYHSKRYYVLGTVVQKGIFPLDRPITIIEAVARARGFETGVSRGNLIETTDFSKSFIGRGGSRLPVDFEKLFLHGDLSQNIALEPGDYLYFPASASGSIYVLGEVRTPGAVTFDADTSVLSSIATRGGFTQRAWKKHVLVVRNVRDHPEAFKVDAHLALTSGAPNLALQPGDIVYVSNRPWIRVEELLDRATSAFVEAAVISWTGVHIGLGGTGAVIVP